MSVNVLKMILIYFMHSSFIFKYYTKIIFNFIQLNTYWKLSWIINIYSPSLLSELVIVFFFNKRTTYWIFSIHFPPNQGVLDVLVIVTPYTNIIRQFLKFWNYSSGFYYSVDSAINYNILYYQIYELNNGNVQH